MYVNQNMFTFSKFQHNVRVTYNYMKLGHKQHVIIFLAKKDGMIKFEKI